MISQTIMNWYLNVLFIEDFLSYAFVCFYNGQVSLSIHSHTHTHAVWTRNKDGFKIKFIFSSGILLQWYRGLFFGGWGQRGLLNVYFKVCFKTVIQILFILVLVMTSIFTWFGHWSSLTNTLYHVHDYQIRIPVLDTSHNKVLKYCFSSLSLFFSLLLAPPCSLTRSMI